ncbi:MAG: chemotaxis protein CheD [Phycisphaerae bacterium]|nr:chemotaxis protein CheD [Phycisphaerae bacterium]
MTSQRRNFDVFLRPGELGVFAGGQRVKTILGSCVAVCLWDRRRRLGGINHFLLPRPEDHDRSSMRYGTVACTQLIQRMYARGARPENLTAAVVGGGAPIRGRRRMASERIGDANTRVALMILAEHGISVQRQVTGGDHGRKLLFGTGDGTLHVRTLLHSHNHDREGSGV